MDQFLYFNESQYHCLDNIWKKKIIINTPTQFPITTSIIIIFRGALFIAYIKLVIT